MKKFDIRDGCDIYHVLAGGCGAVVRIFLKCGEKYEFWGCFRFKKMTFYAL
ncbi:hypothetical protein [Anaerobiospirillum succiniciproducens]|uniref:hypothetical protein n=1 Tax=Anaerobiospirillum succiniciproducens TaxID=13335 RepID=UPI00248DB421|nr:hypothetical protein [Anaerobiospirillum succiniciproducens]